jgi:hypothetical protein
MVDIRLIFFGMSELIDIVMILLFMVMGIVLMQYRLVDMGFIFVAHLQDIL